MRLRYIKLAGFKSFADVVKVEVSGNLTGVVGPNGCGKSNIIDAVRWVLGERSINKLRGMEMTRCDLQRQSNEKTLWKIQC